MNDEGTSDDAGNGRKLAQSLHRARESVELSALFSLLTKEIRKTPSLGSISDRTITIPLIPPSPTCLSITLDDGTLASKTEDDTKLVVEVWKGMVGLYAQSPSVPIIATSLTLLRHGSRRTELHGFLTLLVTNLAHYTPDGPAPSLSHTETAKTRTPRTPTTTTRTPDDLMDRYEGTVFASPLQVSVTSSVRYPDRAKYSLVSPVISTQTYSFSSFRQTILFLVRESLMAHLTAPLPTHQTGTGRAVERVGEDKVRVVASGVCVALSISPEGRITLQKVDLSRARQADGKAEEREDDATSLDPVAMNIVDAIMQLH